MKSGDYKERFIDPSALAELDRAIRWLLEGEEAA